MKNYIQQGVNLTALAPYDVVSGAGVKIGDLFGIAAGAADSGDDVDFVTEGVFALLKVTANTFAVGAKVYWDDSAKNATSTASGNTLIGAAVAIAANGDTTVAVRLNV